MLVRTVTYCIATAMVLLSVRIARLSASTADGGQDGRKLAVVFEQQVARRLVVSPHIQAAIIFWKSPDGTFYLIGATPVSTGRPGTYEHFLTPVGVYEHRTSNLDFRAKGTANKLGIRGYGVRGMRVFDFGWVKAPKGWGNHAISRLRLQVHATDPNRLESRLGTAQSEGCVRTTASFDVFLDHYGILDGDYEQAARKGERFSVLASGREQTPWSGRYLVVVDSERQARPVWNKSSRPTPPRNRAGG